MLKILFYHNYLMFYDIFGNPDFYGDKEFLTHTCLTLYAYSIT